MKAQVIRPGSPLPGPRKTVFSASIDITEQDGVCAYTLERQHPDSDASVGARVRKLLEEIVAERNKSAA